MDTSCHVSLFYYYDDRKHDFATTSEHIKHIIELLNNWQIIFLI